MDLRAEVLKDVGEGRAGEVRVEILLGEDPTPALTEVECALLGYVDRVTREPWSCREEHVGALRDVGASDEQIHAVVQVAAYFAYINRVADGLGVDLEPEMGGGEE